MTLLPLATLVLVPAIFGASCLWVGIITGVGRLGCTLGWIASCVYVGLYAALAF